MTWTLPIVPIRLETTLRRVDVSFNRKLFNTRSTTTTSSFRREEALSKRSWARWNEVGERREGEEGGGGRVISISGGETRIFRVPRLYCIPFRGGAIHFWCDGQTESANALWRGPTPLWCFLQRLCCTISRNNAPPEGFSLFLSREISASSCRGNVTNPRKFHSWPQSARSKDDGWRWDRTRRCFGKKGKRTLIRGVSWCNAGKYGRFLRGRKVKVRRRFFFFLFAPGSEVNVSICFLCHKLCEVMSRWCSSRA